MTPAAPNRAGAPDRGTGAGRARGSVLFLACAALYLAVGWYLALVHHVVEGDALARVENASAVLWSRTPHLAAIGFVWPPLPSLLDLPMLTMAGRWPAITAYGLPGITGSALAMAAAVVAVRRTCCELGARSPVRTVLVALFALNPVIVYFAANGMTEAWLIAFLAGASLHLTRWVGGGATRHLALAATWIALAYLCRYEALGAGVLLVAAAAVRVYRLSPGGRRRRLAGAGSTALVAGYPLAVVFLGWALASRIITGDAFEQFGSAYGNASIVEVATAAEHSTPVGRAVFSWQRTLELAPTLPVLVVLALRAWTTGRRARLAGPMVATGGAMLCVYGVMVTGLSFQWLRFHILALPLATMLAAALCAPAAPGSPRPAGRRPGRTRTPARAVLLLSGPALALLTSWTTMVSPHGWAQLALSQALDGPDPQSAYAWSRRIADDLEEMAAPQGSVLVSMAGTFEAVAVSGRPRIFVIPSDPDYTASLAQPCPAVRYLLSMPENPLDPVAGLVRDLREGRPEELSRVKDYGTGASGGPVFELWRTRCGE